jgi:DNA uptake protein ComE-like DNA-binding protein
MNQRLTAVGSLRMMTVAVVLTACQSNARDASRDSAAPQAGAPSPAATPTDTGAHAATQGATSAGAMLDPNTATREQLVAVPGMTPAAADALIAGRPHANMVAANRALAAQVDSAQRKTIYSRVWKPIDLNTASGDEILLIPGVGPRMRHEFEEYRPYKNIDQFRREIGKYVDKNEVARLEKYVTIR